MTTPYVRQLERRLQDIDATPHLDPETAEERAFIVGELEFAAELKRRSDEVRSGRAVLVPHEAVIERLRGRLRERARLLWGESIA